MYGAGRGGAPQGSDDIDLLNDATATYSYSYTKLQKLTLMHNGQDTVVGSHCHRVLATGSRTGREYF